MKRLLWIASATLVANTQSAQDYVLDPGNPQVFALCYENNVDSAISCSCSDGSPLVLNICIGQIEAYVDRLTIYDGLDETAPVLYISGGSTDLSGIVVVSTGNGLTCWLNTDDTISCATDGFLPIVFSVNCSEAVGCDIGVREWEQARRELLPDPCDGWLNWRLPSTTAVPVIHVLDNTGRVVHTVPAQRVMGGAGSLDLRDLAPGQYVLRFDAGDRVWSGRFTIVR